MAFCDTGSTNSTNGTGTFWRTLTNSTALFIVGIATGFVEFVADRWLGATTWITERIVSVAASMPRLLEARAGWAARLAPSVLLVKARAFVDRIAHRDLRRGFDPAWQACPPI